MKRSIALALVSCLAGPAGAQSLVPGPNQAGRYEMQPVDGGIARLDTVTGEVSLCRIEAGTMRCQQSEEDRARLEGRIRELSGGAGARPSQSPPPATDRSPKPGVDAGDGDAEFDAAIGRMKRVFRAFHDIAREFEDNGDADAPPSEPSPDRT